MELQLNTILTNLFLNNWLALVLVIILLLPIIPPKWFNYDEFLYYYTNGVIDPTKTQKRQKITILSAFFHVLFGPVDAFLRFFTNVSALFSFRETITVLIFIVVGFDILSRNIISNEAITFAAIGILSLYLQNLIDNADEMTFFFNLIKWKRKGLSFINQNSTGKLKKK